jgi:UDP-glucose 4-epimerase
MKVLVTGGLGFVGSNLTDLLVEKGCQVSVIDDLSSESSSLYNANPKSEVSISTVEKSSFMKESYDVIFHLAAKARIQPSFENPFECLSENYMNALRVFQKAADDGSRIIFASTSSSQGGKMISPYTFSKVIGEDLLRMYNQIYKTQGTIVRFFNVYGPREPKTGEWATVIAKFLRQYKNGEPLSVVGDGLQSRDFTHVSDICEGLFRISQKPAWELDIRTELAGVDLGRGEPHSIMDVVEMFHPGPVEGRDFVHVPLRRNEPMKTKADALRLEMILDWSPSASLKKYIEKEKNS